MTDKKFINLETIPIQSTSGVYVIINKKNNKLYFGESQNVFFRLEQHKSELRNNRHNLREFQGDWNKYGPESFSFEIIVLNIDKEIPRDVRRQIENGFIAEFADLCYNEVSNPLKEKKKTEVKTNTPHTLIINGVAYESVREAARTYGMTPSTIRNRLNRGLSFDIISSEQIDKLAKARVEIPSVYDKTNSKKVVVNGRFFSSIKAAERGTGLSNSTVRRRLASPDSRNYFVFENTADLQVLLEETPFMCNGLRFPSIKYAEKQLKTKAEAIFAKVSSPSIKDWFFINKKNGKNQD